MGIEPLDLLRNILRIIITSQQGNYTPSGGKRS